jgi:hypothetical protein
LFDRHGHTTWPTPAPSARRRTGWREQARELGFRALVLSTPSVAQAPHRLYESIGFVRDPARDWSPVPRVELFAYVLLLD